MTKRTLLSALGLAFFATSILPGGSSTAWGEPRLNAQRVSREPGWSGPTRLTGDDRVANESVPILERPYRPFHVMGNTTRRHHYRGTIIPSHRDRVDMLQALTTGGPVAPPNSGRWD